MLIVPRVSVVDGGHQPPRAQSLRYHLVCFGSILSVHALSETKPNTHLPLWLPVLNLDQSQI
jgi:hypothetical protein